MTTNSMYSDEPETCSIHGCEMDGEYCAKCEAEAWAEIDVTPGPFPGEVPERD